MKSSLPAKEASGKEREIQRLQEIKERSEEKRRKVQEFILRTMDELELTQASFNQNEEQIFKFLDKLIQ